VTAPDSHRLDVDADWWQPDVQTLPVGAPFRPGLDPIPAHQHAWAVVKDRWGLPAHGEPRDALRTVITAVPAIGPNDVLGYVLHAGLTYNTIFAARGVPISVFDLHDGDLHVPGSGAVVLVAAVGAEVARDGRIHVGELRVLVPGVSNLLSHVAGADPMFADFKIQGYETPDGTFAQFVRAQAPQLLAHSERLTLAEASSFMLDLQTVYKAIYDVARAVPGERVFVEGAAGGTGVYAVAGAVLRGCAVTGLVSSDARGELVRARGGRAYVDRTAPGIAGIFTAIPSDQAARAAWIAAGAPFVGAVRERNDGALMDIVVASTGRDVFPRSVELLAPGGRLVFFGATTGYTLTLLGKPGRASAADMLRRADLRPREGVMLYYGAGDADRVGDEAIDAAVAAGARVVAVASTDAQAAGARRRAGDSRRRQRRDPAPERRPRVARGDAGLRHRPGRVPRVPGSHPEAAGPGGGTAPRDRRQPPRLARRRDRARGRGHPGHQHVPRATVHGSHRLPRGHRGPAAVVLRPQRLDAPEARAVPRVFDPGQSPLEQPSGLGGAAAAGGRRPRRPSSSGPSVGGPGGREPGDPRESTPGHVHRARRRRPGARRRAQGA
jgi:NADPH:quinone reductase-like Zn-dependent oxidoreductase